MSYLLDTNIISETIKLQPNKHVISWLKGIEIDKLFLSVITLGEIRKGIENVQDFNKKNKIMHWLERDLLKEFTGRILTIDSEVADKWGYISATVEIPAIDALIGATAIVNNLKLVTRNMKDFIMVPGLEIINPWVL